MFLIISIRLCWNDNFCCFQLSKFQLSKKQITFRKHIINSAALHQKWKKSNSQIAFYWFIKPKVKKKNCFKSTYEIDRNNSIFFFYRIVKLEYEMFRNKLFTPWTINFIHFLSKMFTLVWRTVYNLSCYWNEQILFDDKSHSFSSIYSKNSWLKFFLIKYSNHYIIDNFFFILI